MELDIVRADPAGNITVFVLTPVRGRRTLVANALLRNISGAEQVGFVTGQGRLEMMGGEFCGNAARSFGLYTAKSLGLCGRHTVNIEISGMVRPLPVYVDTAGGTASVDLPGPIAETSVEHAGKKLPVYVFEGITHIIAEDVQADQHTVRALIRRLGENGHKPEALGAMFFDSRKNFMRPVVWVAATESLVSESSCGSGSAALGIWAMRDVGDGEKTMQLAQPGGLIEVTVTKQAGRVQRVCIGGKVGLGEVERITLDSTGKKRRYHAVQG